jgi:hypothetical protein
MRITVSYGAGDNDEIYVRSDFWEVTVSRNRHTMSLRTAPYDGWPGTDNVVNLDDLKQAARELNELVSLLSGVAK